jgi:hypothetical protein
MWCHMGAGMILNAKSCISVHHISSLVLQKGRFLSYLVALTFVTDLHN